MKYSILYPIVILGVLAFACKQAQKTATAKGTALLEQSAQDPMADYKAQKHRFEIKTCKLYYNGQQVILDSLHLFEEVMGKEHLGKFDYYYKDKPLSFKTKRVKWGDTTEVVIKLAIKMSNNTETTRNIEGGYHSLVKKRDSMNYNLPTLKGYVLIDGQLVDVNTKIEDFNRNRKEEDLPLFTPFLGIRNPGVTYGYSYCQPAYNAKGTSEVTLYYNDENEFEENHRTTTVWQLRYSYEN